MTKRSRSEVVAEVEKLGVVAIIRMPDPAALRAVVDALAEGGVRALEVTMTVPRAIELIAEIAPTLPARFPLRRGHGARCRHRASRGRRRRAVHRQSRCSGARSSKPRMKKVCP